MITSVPRSFRILFAVLLTALFLSCMGFGVFGVLASREPGPSGPYFMVAYIVFLLVIIAVLCLTWWVALRRWDTDLKSVCSGCGYNLRGLAELRCPECGAPVAID